MQEKCSLFSSYVSYDSAVDTRSNPASLNDKEPRRLHDVNKDLWQRTFQAVMANGYNKAPILNLSFGQRENSLPTLKSGTIPQPLRVHVFPSPDTPDHCNSTPEPATIGPEFKSEPNQDATPAQVQSPRRWGSRPFSCPVCRTYTTNRKYNLKRHRETRHGKRRHSN
ncbi:hypothetical protein FCOIX_6021 [Fusarium coicis]|nr:hypothetical protein FCOIX_6021 [Fusarium coicis]